jgi:hypothetical protein
MLSNAKHRGFSSLPNPRFFGAAESFFLRENDSSRFLNQIFGKCIAEEISKKDGTRN